MKRSSLNLVLTGLSEERVVMIEMEGNEVPLEDLVRCIDVGLKSVQQIIQGIGQLAAGAGKSKRSVCFLLRSFILLLSRTFAGNSYSLN